MPATYLRLVFSEPYPFQNGLKVYFKACIFNGLERNIIASKAMKN